MPSHLNHLLIAAGLLGTAALSHGAAIPHAAISPASEAPSTGQPDSGSTDETAKARYDINVVHEAADSFSAFEGRAILVEFFAHW